MPRQRPGRRRPNRNLISVSGPWCRGFDLNPSNVRRDSVCWPVVALMASQSEVAFRRNPRSVSARQVDMYLGAYLELADVGHSIGR